MILKKTVTIHSHLGLHARPASLFARIANKYQSSVNLKKDGETANGKSIMALLTLAASQGSRLEIEVFGEDAQEAMTELSHFIEMDEQEWGSYDPKDGK